MKRMLLLSALGVCACAPAIIDEPVQPSVTSIEIQEEALGESIRCIAAGNLPHISGLPSTQVEANINSVFEEYLFEVREGLRECSEDAPASASELRAGKEEVEVLYATDIDYEVTLLDDAYFSVVILRSRYMEGAAHPENTIDTFVFRIADSELLSLEDFLDEQQLAALPERVAEAAEEEDIGPYPSETSNPIEKFYITKDSLVLVDLFTSYAVQGFEVRIERE